LAERKILYEIGQDEFALKALVAEQEIRYQSKPTKKKVSTTSKNFR
jgi:hypothetical protein